MFEKLKLAIEGYKSVLKNNWTFQEIKSAADNICSECDRIIKQAGRFESHVASIIQIKEYMSALSDGLDSNGANKSVLKPCFEHAPIFMETRLQKAEEAYSKSV